MKAQYERSEKARRSGLSNFEKKKEAGDDKYVPTTAATTSNTKTAAPDTGPDPKPGIEPGPDPNATGP